ncbi:MAG: hypothetical protein ACO1PW_14365 [Actinomycetota bacterium]
MAKHTGHRSGGGRTTPKGTRPAGTDAGHRHEHREAVLPRAPQLGPAAHQAAGYGAHAPVRAGHNRGQR